MEEQQQQQPQAPQQQQQQQGERSLPNGIKLPSFGGGEGEDANKFITLISQIFNVYRITYEARIGYLLSCLSDIAQDWLTVNFSQLPNSWEGFIVFFRTRFIRVDHLRQARKKFFGIKQGKDQTVSEYISIFSQQNQIHKLDPESSIVLFIQGLHPIISSKVFADNPLTLEAAMQKAFAYGFSNPINSQPNPIPMDVSNISLNSKNSMNRIQNFKNQNHNSNDYNKNRNYLQNRNTEIERNKKLSKDECLAKNICYYCKRNGHTISNCFKLKNKQGKVKQ